MRRSLFALLIIALAVPAHARHASSPQELQRTVAPAATASDNPARNEAGLSAAATNETTWLYSANFNTSPSACTPQGWTTVDLTASAGGDFWHVDDYAGLSFSAVTGTKSLWCGARTLPQVAACSYQTLPGYGNLWDQRWCTKNCIDRAGGATTQLDVSFQVRLDTEPSYDVLTLEYTNDCTGSDGWAEAAGVQQTWSGQNTLNINASYGVVGNPVRVRLRFVSDSSWSDEDGLFPTNGAAHIDNLKVEALAIETFEDEAAGAASSNDWQSCNNLGPTSAFGNYAALFSGGSLVQQDPCVTNVSCMWAFILGSTETYACGGFPGQITVPYMNDNGVAIVNEVWSLPIALSGSGNTLNLQFDVYRDVEVGATLFYRWNVRALTDGCPSTWQNNGLGFQGDDRTWFKQTARLGNLIGLSTATHVQVSLGVIDLCPLWCGTVSAGCHSDAPMFDNVKLYRVNTTGPEWTVRDTDLFQDTFAQDGTLTGIARADIALDVKPESSPSFTPGDSGIVIALSDPAYSGTGTNTSGLSNDPNVSTFVGRHKTKKQFYMWVAVWPQGQPNKSGGGLSEGPGGQANRYPHIAAKDYIDSHGVTWSAIRADYTYTGTAATPGLGTGTQPIADNRFNVDLNDNLFVPGDTICFFYGATSPGGTTYYSDQWNVTSNIAEVAANPMEFTVLPAGGYNRGGNILYVDGADGYGSQPYFEGAFMVLGLRNKVDRYDVRGPASGESNTLSGRIYDIAAQLNAPYQNIIWDCGSLSMTLGDGNSRKSDDYGMLNMFLGNLIQPGGIYLSGDDVAERLASSVAFSALVFTSNYMPFNLSSGDHRAAGLGVSPKVVHWPSRAFSDDFTVFGGCPEMNDFDVLNASGASRVEMSYGTAQSLNGAVLSRQTNNGTTIATVEMSGFSFAAIRDDETNGISDRGKFLATVLSFTGNSTFVTGAGPELRNSLAQNYPNPFNPQTTISFSIAQRANVRLAVYDVNGALVRTLASETRAAGAYQITWDGRDDSGNQVASGVYFYRLATGSFTQTKKMVLLK